jgi:hypothetical protein
MSKAEPRHNGPHIADINDILLADASSTAAIIDQGIVTIVFNVTPSFTINKPHSLAQLRAALTERSKLFDQNQLAAQPKSHVTMFSRLK